MLSEFEQQFETTLRSKLPEAVRPQVQVATGSATQKGILVGVNSVVPAADEIGSVRSEFAPGITEPRRVVRLRCVVECVFVPTSAAQARSDLMNWLDLVVYALDDADVRDGSAFKSAAPDPGFLIRSMTIDTASSPFVIHGAESESLRLSLIMDGWFWPVGQAGQAGVEIGEIRLRGISHPLLVIPAMPTLTANGPTVDLRIAIETRGQSRITAENLASAAFGNIIARIEKLDGTTGAGTLSGGTAGVGGSRILAVTGNHIDVSYTPPATPAEDILILSLETDSSESGIELARFTLETGPAL